MSIAYTLLIFGALWLALLPLTKDRQKEHREANAPERKVEENPDKSAFGSGV